MSALETIIKQFGEQVSLIKLDNVVSIYLGYPQKPECRHDTVEFHTFDGEDWFSVPKYPNSKADVVDGLTARWYYPCSTVQGVIIRDESCGDRLLNPEEVG